MNATGKFFRLLAACVLGFSAAAACATDQTPLTLGVTSTFQATGTFSDTTHFTTNVDGASFNVYVRNYYHIGTCTGGRGANCTYEISVIYDVTVKNAAGGVMCNGAAAPGSGPLSYIAFNCGVASAPAGTYTVLTDGKAYTKTKLPGSEKDANEPYYVTATGE